MIPEFQFASSDAAVLDLLRQRDAMTVSQLASELKVTATAVRQRLNRLMAQGYIERRVVKASRGRPSHHYVLTKQGLRTTGDNFQDLAIALWGEIRAVQDPQIRQGLLQRVARRMAEGYAGQIEGETVDQRMESLAAVYGERRVAMQVDRKDKDGNSLPVLNALACPYPALAEQDRSICAMERLMFAELLETKLRLTQCRLDGGACCTFE